MSIPKIIWQTHEYEYEDLPYPYNLNSLTWQEMNPDFEYRYASADQRHEDIKKYGADVLDFYLSIHSDLGLDQNVLKADIWRYVVLRQFGGIYADLDSVCLNNLNKIDLTPDFIYNTPPGKEKCSVCDIVIDQNILNGFIGSTPNNKIFDLVLSSFLKKGLCNSWSSNCSVFRFSKACSDAGIDYRSLFQYSMPIFAFNQAITSNCQNGLCHETIKGLNVSICHGDWHKNNYKQNKMILENNTKKNVF